MDQKYSEEYLSTLSVEEAATARRFLHPHVVAATTKTSADLFLSAGSCIGLPRIEEPLAPLAPLTVNRDSSPPPSNVRLLKPICSPEESNGIVALREALQAESDHASDINGGMTDHDCVRFLRARVMNMHMHVTSYG